MPCVQFALRDADATGLLRDRRTTEWHAWRFVRVSDGLWVDPGVDDAGVSIVLQAVGTDEISTMRRYVVMGPSWASMNPVVLRSSEFDCGRKLKIGPTDPGLRWEVGLTAPGARSGKPAQLFVPVAGLFVEAAACSTEAEVRAERSAAGELLVLTSSQSRALTGPCGVYRRVQRLTALGGEYRFRRVGDGPGHMLSISAGSGVTCTVSQERDAGVFEPCARLYGHRVLASIADAGRGIYFRRWIQPRPPRPRCMLELATAAEVVLLRSPGRSEHAGVFGLGRAPLCGSHRPFAAVRDAESTGDALAVPRAALAAVVALLSVLSSALPPELAALVGSYVQFGWWPYGRGRCRGAELPHLTNRDRAAIEDAAAAACAPNNGKAILHAAEVSMWLPSTHFYYA